MHKVLLLGAGKIGRMIGKLLQDSGDFEILVGDHDPEALERMRGLETTRLDASDPDQLLDALQDCDSVISALSYRFSLTVAQAALKAGCSYFDLTEDVASAGKIKEVAEQATPGQIFMPQCGLAPGFISIIAHHLTQEFDSLETVHLRVGALPQFPSNALKYNLTWSTDGLINEYCNLCDAIHEHKRIRVLPLEGYEHFSLDGVRYECFHTSGGLGTLCESLEGKVRELNYKTIRYPGHRDLMLFLVNELRLSQRRDLLKDILENAVPVTFQDVVVIFCTVIGKRHGQLVQISDARKIYQQVIDDEVWSSIQITTAASLCAAVDLHRQQKLPDRGFVRQEQVSLTDFLRNRFGQYYQAKNSTETTMVGHGFSRGVSYVPPVE